MRRACLTAAAVVAAFVAVGSARQASGTGPYAVLKTAKVGGLGGFDYIYADEGGRRLYIPRTASQGPTPAPARVSVFDLDTLAAVGEK